MTAWDDMNPRARGLATHLLTGAQMRALAGAADLPALAEALRELGFNITEPASAAALEQAVRRHAAAQLRLLARWAGARAAPLAAVFEDLEWRNLRIIVRGAVQGVAVPQRMAGLLPTPSLSERTLAELCRQDSVLKISALLTAWRNPYGRPLLPHAASPQPDLLRMETALHRTFASRAARAAGRNQALRAFVHETIDTENALTAIVLAGRAGHALARDCFLRGGSVVTRAVYDAASAADGAEAAAAMLARAYDGSPFATALRQQGASPADVAAAMDHAHITVLTARRRRDPLEPTTIVLFAVRLRVQAADVRRIVWGVALRAPAAVRLGIGA